MKSMLSTRALVRLSELGLLVFLSGLVVTALVFYDSCGTAFDPYSTTSFADATRIDVICAVTPIGVLVIWTAFICSWITGKHASTKWAILLTWAVIGLIVEFVFIGGGDLLLLSNMDKFSLPTVIPHGMLLIGISPWGGAIVVSALALLSSGILLVMRCARPDRSLAEGNL
jgi:hypothetical protein